MEDSPAIPELPPSEIAGYRISRTLTPAQSFLALAPGGRTVVLKVLDADCLLRGQLHPSIRDRLGRVRELAHGGVANLHSVERDGGNAYLVWEYVPGRNLGEHAASLKAPAELAVLAREVILAVEALHAQGIVHGALHGGNIIVDNHSRVRLTHISPLLYDDPAADVHDVLCALAAAVQQRQWGGSEVARILSEAETSPASLPRLRSRLAPGGEYRAQAQSGILVGDGGLRNRAVVGAIIVLLIGIAIAAGVTWKSEKSAPKLPTPLEAPAR